MKKFLISMIVLLTVFSILAVKTIDAHAADDETSEVKESTEDSTVTISFDENNLPTLPQDPDDPSQPGEGPGTGAPGPLSIDFISALTFGTGHKISSSEQSYNTTISKPYLQVSDLRGTGGGWNVTAQLSVFNDGENDSLKGAYITLKNAAVISANSAITAPVANQNIVLTSDGASVNVVSAAANSGLGTWITKWYPASGDNNYVTLTVPASAATKGTHTASITWTLSDTP